MRSACQGSGSNTAGVAQGSMGSKEMHYVLRVLGPAACRCPELFTEVARESLQIAIPHPSAIPSGRMGMNVFCLFSFDVENISFNFPLLLMVKSNSGMDD